MSLVQEVQPERRRRGRPRKCGEATVSVSTRIPESEAARLTTIARAHRIPVARLVRQVLIVVLGPRREG
jgi:hypothetical protein